MTISSTVRTAGPYTGTGSVNTYPFAFKVFQASDLLAQQTDTSGNLTTLVLTTNYSVTLNADQNASPGGSIVLNSNLPNGYELILSSQVPELQGTSITNNGGFYPSVIETALDYLTILVQQVQTSLSNTLTIPLGATAYNAFGARIGGLGDGINPTDAVNLAQVQGMIVGGAAPALAGPSGSSFVGYTQAGSGAVLQTAQARLRIQVWVTDYTGADSTGVTDSSAAFASALTYLSSLANGGILRVPQGRFLINSAQTVPPNVSIVGEGPGTVIVGGTANMIMFSQINASPTFANTSIEALTLQTAVAGVVGIKFQLCYRTVIRNVQFLGLSQNFNIDRGQYHRIANCLFSGLGTRPCGTCRVWSSSDTDYVWAVTITDLIVENVGTGNDNTYDTAIIYVRRGTGVLIQHVYAFSLGAASGPGVATNGIIIENDSQGCKIADCELVGPKIGIAVQMGSGVAVSPIFLSITNVDIDQATTQAIIVANGNYITITGGGITASAVATTINPVLINATAIVVIIQGLIVSGYNGVGGSGIYLNGCANVVIDGCVIDNCYYGFVFSGNTYTTIINTQLRACTNKLNGTFTGTGNSYARCVGLNPLTVTTPGFPTSGTTVTNTQGVRCSVYITGGTITAYAINGISLNGITGAQTIDLEPGETITMTYTGSPVWTWIGH